jgi:hypothetical protein
MTMPIDILTKQYMTRDSNWSAVLVMPVSTGVFSDTSIWSWRGGHLSELLLLTGYDSENIKPESLPFVGRGI